MKKNVVLTIAVIALLLLTACSYKPDEPIYSEYIELPGTNKPTDNLDMRKQLLDMGFSEAELDMMIANGISLGRIFNQTRFSEYADKINNSQPIGPSGEVILPRYYGGIYFDDEGILTVTVLDEAFIHAASAIAIAEMLELGIMVRTATFADQELNAAMNTLNQMADRAAKSGATSWSLDTKGNKVFVDLDPYTDEQKAVFLDLLLEASIDPAMIVLRQAVTQEMLDLRAASITAAAQSPGDQIVLIGDVEVSRTGIAFSLENRTDLTFCYGAHWDLAYYSDECWTPVPHLPGAGNPIWPYILYSMQSGEVQQHRQEWDFRFGERTPGRYMYILDGELGDWHQDIDTVYALVEFYITVDSPANLPPQSDEAQ
ncbi:MAG: S1 family peptidase [Oscillospiraceae bacterium]|jgi:hypothetical protein|nr:S1 family peptidase [Oscillospiraceae bacterium]